MIMALTRAKYGRQVLGPKARSIPAQLEGLGGQQARIRGLKARPNPADDNRSGFIENTFGPEIDLPEQS